jgi:DNA-binding response OmpR family regulator
MMPVWYPWKPERTVTALAVSQDPKVRIALRGIFSDADWVLHEAGSMLDVLARLKRFPIEVVISDREFPGGAWRDVLDTARRLHGGVPLVVTSRLADEYLWAEVLNEGGYDVLAQPFDPEEVVRVLSAATRRRTNESRRVHLPALSAGA